MPILLTRIDDRLIHGQVVVGWAQALHANHIVVVDDEIVNNEMQKFLFRTATPSEIMLDVMSIKDAAAAIKKRQFDDTNTIILLKSPGNVCGLVKAGGKIGEVNIGGMHFTGEKTQLFDAVFVDGVDVEMFEALDAMKVSLEVRMVPGDTKKDILKAIKEKYYKKKG